MEIRVVSEMVRCPLTAREMSGVVRFLLNGGGMWESCGGRQAVCLCAVSHNLGFQFLCKWSSRKMVGVAVLHVCRGLQRSRETLRC